MQLGQNTQNIYISILWKWWRVLVRGLVVKVIMAKIAKTGLKETVIPPKKDTSNFAYI